MSLYEVNVTIILEAKDQRDAATRAITTISDPDRCVEFRIEPRGADFEIIGPERAVHLNPEEYPSLPNCPRCGTRNEAVALRTALEDVLDLIAEVGLREHDDCKGDDSCAVARAKARLGR